MPKFLDAPSWYDNTGTLRTLSGTVRFNSQAGFVDLPYTSFASAGARSPYYVLNSAGTNGNIVYSNGYYPVYLPNGTSGQVLSSNGDAAPSWKNLSLTTTKLYCHNIQMSYSYSATYYYHIMFSFFSTRNTAYEISSVSRMITDIYNQYKNELGNCYILAAGFAQGVSPSVSVVSATSTTLYARSGIELTDDEYEITSYGDFYDEYFSVVNSVSLNT